MTTDLVIRRASDVFVDNAVLRLDHFSTGPEIAVAGWFTNGEPTRDAHRSALMAIASLTLAKLSAYALWLLAGHSTWQPDSRITRHRALWGSLKARGLGVPFGREAAQGLVEAEGGLRFFGAIQLGLASLDSAIAIIEAEPASHLVALPAGDDSVVAGLAHSGWERAKAAPSIEVMCSVCNSEGIVLWPVGAFDDRESGAVALAKPEVIDQLLR